MFCALLGQLSGERLQDHWSSGFYSGRISSLVAMATYSSHGLIMRKM